jgi:hypothetical protein
MSFIEDIRNEISAANSTTSLLGASATFTGAWEDVTEFNTCAVAILGSVATDGTLYFDLSTDGGATFASVPSTISDTTFAVPRILNIVETHIRIRYVNGTTAQTGTFSIQTKYTLEGAMELLSSIEGTITGEYPTQVVRSIAGGKNPNDNYTNVPNSGISDKLTTTTPLGISGVWTSDWQDVELYGEIKFAMTTDVASASCLIQLSHDGVNVDTSLSLPPQNGSGYGFIHSLNPSLPYVRIVYTNGTTAQTTFKFKTILLVNSGGGFVSRATQVLDRYTDVKNFRVVNSPTQDRNFGFINYQQSKRVIGRNAAVPGSGFETIWSGADNGLPAIYPTVTAAETVRVKSGGNANDDVAGSGARKVMVYGLDSSFNEISEEISLAGTSASSATTNSFIAINEVCVSEWGTFEGENSGAIIIENTSSTQGLAAINAGVGRAQSCIYTIPAGKTMYMKNISLAVGDNNTADVSLYSFKDLSDQTAPLTAGKTIEWEVVDYAGARTFSFDTYLKFEEKSFVRFDAKRNSGSGNAFISLTFDFILVDN